MTETATETETPAKSEPVDLSFLAKAKTTKATITNVARGRRSEPNPVEPFFLESFNTRNDEGYGDVRALKVTAGTATRVESLLRKAAMDRSGISIQMQLDAKGAETVSLEGVKELEPETPVWVAFQAKPKQVQNRRPRNESANGDAPAEDTAEDTAE